MARVVLTSFGFWGDVVPYVPIARELGRRGHDVRFALPATLHGLLAGEPFVVVDSGSTFSIADLLADAEQVRLLETRAMALHGRDLARSWADRYLVREFDVVVDRLLGELAGADLLLTHPVAGVLGGAAADVAGVPWMTGHLFPMLLPSVERSPAALRIPPLPGRAGPALRRGAWRLTEAATAYATYDEELHALRARRGLPPVRAAMTMSGVSRRRTIVQVSPRYAPPPTDWPPTWRTTGFTVWDGPAGAGLDPEIDAWIGAGDPPVAVSLGSSAASAAGPVLADVAAVLDDLGLRGLFLVAHEANVAALGDRPGVFPFAPLPAVLPRCRALVQSGAHGTNAAALVAGTPTVTVPLLFDQVWHGRRTRALGLGRMVKGAGDRRARLRRALARVTGDDRYRARAAAFAAVLATEDGVGAACDEVEAVLAGR